MTDKTLEREVYAVVEAAKFWAKHESHRYTDEFYEAQDGLHAALKALEEAER